MSQFVLITLLVFVTTIPAFLSARRYHDGGYEADGRDYYDGSSRSSRCTGRQSHRNIVKKFLKNYCADVAADYQKCRNCVAVACLRYIDRPEQGDQYDECIAEHNRCCTPGGGLSGNTAGMGARCYLRGLPSETILGHVSVVKSVAGMQSPKAPNSFYGTGA